MKKICFYKAPTVKICLPPHALLFRFGWQINPEDSKEIEECFYRTFYWLLLFFTLNWLLFVEYQWKLLYDFCSLCINPRRTWLDLYGEGQSGDCTKHSIFKPSLDWIRTYRECSMQTYQFLIILHQDQEYSHSRAFGRLMWVFYNEFPHITNNFNAPW